MNSTIKTLFPSNYTDVIIPQGNYTREWTDDSDPLRMEIVYYLLAMLVAICLTVTYFVVFNRVEHFILYRDASSCCVRSKREDALEQVSVTI